MRLTEKQAIILFDIAKCSMSFIGGCAGYSPDTIQTVVNQILNQQSDQLIELDRREDEPINTEIL